MKGQFVGVQSAERTGEYSIINKNGLSYSDVQSNAHCAMNAVAFFFHHPEAGEPAQHRLVNVSKNRTAH